MKTKKIKSIVVYYDDGTYEEVQSAVPPGMFPPYQSPVAPYKIGDQPNWWDPPYRVTCSSSTSTVYLDPIHD